MRTTAAPAGTTFLHNGDYSGDILVPLPQDEWARVAIPFSQLAQSALAGADEVVELTGVLNGSTQPVSVSLPAADVRFLLADRYANEQIARLEAATPEELYAFAAPYIQQWAAPST